MGACCCKSAAIDPGADGLEGAAYKQPVSGTGTPAGHGSPAKGNTHTPNVLRLLKISMSPSVAGTQDGSTAQLSEADKDSQPDVINSESAVKVAVLVRPLLPSEQGDVDVLQSVGGGQLLISAKDKSSHRFLYDAVYRLSSMQARKDMFKSLGQRVVERVCQGFNGAILAYGQTGSGKTYNMGTAESMAEALKPGTAAAAAVLPSVIHSLWSYITAAQQQYNIAIKVKYIEIYNENVQDLLRGFKPAKTGALLNPWLKADTKPDIKENAAGEVVVDGATQVLVCTPEELAAAADYAAACRVTAAHKMNDQSSRSHAILILTMEQRASPTAMQQLPVELHYLRSQLHLVDLAGSERVKETGAQGLRFQEGVSINKGLLELGNVISALAEPGSKRKHVPYRNSKLTRVLQDCLGGNAETLMLACVSPASCNFEQTLNTLRYAQRARAIRNQLCLNNKPQSLEEELAYLRGMVQQLQADNARLQELLDKQQSHE